MKMTMKAAAAAVMAVCAASAAHAAGFMLTEQSAGALGRAYAGVGVDGTDLSGVYYNPATMTLHPGTQIQAGFVAVGLDLAFEGNDGVTTENGQYNTQAIPHGYISHQISDSMWVGLAMTVPFGMGTEYDDNWAYANRGISAEVLTFDFNPNVAWKVSDKLSLGAGMSIQYAKADLKMKDNIIKSVPALGTVNGEVDADSWAWGFNIGLMWTPVENLRFGLSYRSKINHNADGDFTLSDADVDMNVANDLISQGLLTPELLAGMQALVNNPQAASATISTPAWLMATAAWDVNHLLSLYATFRWTDWSSFDTLDIKSPVALASQGGVKTVENHWQDTYLSLSVPICDSLTGGRSVPVSVMKPRQLTILPTVQRLSLMLTVGGLHLVLPSRQPRICKLTCPPLGSTAQANVTCIPKKGVMLKLVASRTSTPTSSAFSWSTSSNPA